LYPGVAIEYIVSIGTGYFGSNNKEANKAQSMDWGVLVTQLVGSATDTEATDRTVRTFFKLDEEYFRFNTMLQDNMAIDEKNKTVLMDLKRLAKETVAASANGPNKKNFDTLINALRGNSR
jgi:dihydroorotate dehydrogenase